MSDQIRQLRIHYPVEFTFEEWSRTVNIVLSQWVVKESRSARLGRHLLQKARRDESVSVARIRPGVSREGRKKLNNDEINQQYLRSQHNYH